MDNIRTLSYEQMNRRHARRYISLPTNSDLTRNELKELYAELANMSWYDNIYKFETPLLREYISQILINKGIDENPDDIIKDLIKKPMLMINAGNKYTFVRANVRDRYTAVNICKSYMDGNKNVIDMLSKEGLCQEVADFMYDINPRCCEMIVLEYLEKFLAENKGWKTFCNYLKASYKEYTVMSKKRAEECAYDLGWCEEYFRNDYRNTLSKLVHLVLKNYTKHHRRYIQDMVIGCSSYDIKLCEKMGSIFKGMKDKPKQIDKCIFISRPENIDTSFIYKEVYVAKNKDDELCENYNPFIDGEKIQIKEEISNNGYFFTILSDELEYLGSSPSDEIQKELKKILMDESICGPYHDYKMLIELKYLLRDKFMMDRKKFGLRRVPS